MSSKEDGDYKKFVKKRIRKGDNSVDNDLSSDDEKWLDKFDLELRKARDVDLSVLPRSQLIRYVQLLINVKERKKLIAQFNITNEELKLNPLKPPEVPPELVIGVDNIDPELKEYILEHVENSISSSSSSGTTCSTSSCSCSTSPSEGKVKEKDNAKASDAAEPAQKGVMSPMRLYLIKPRTPPTSESSSLSTYKSSWQGTSTSSLSSSTTVTPEKEKIVKKHLLPENSATKLQIQEVKPLADICKNIIIDVFEKANIDLPPLIANMPFGKENQPPEKRLRSRSRSMRSRSSTSLKQSSESEDKSVKGLSKKTSKHSSDMSLTPVVGRSPQPGRILRSSSRSTGTVSSSSLTTLSSNQDGNSSKKTRSKSSGKQTTRSTSKKYELGESLGSTSMSLTPKESPTHLGSTNMPLTPKESQTGLESVSEVTVSSDSSSITRKSSKMSVVTSSDSENTILPPVTTRVLRSISRNSLSNSDSSSNKPSKNKSTTTFASTTSTSLSTSEEGSSNSLSSLSNSKMVTSTPLETPFLSPSSEKGGETGHLAMTEASSNEMDQSDPRRSKSTSVSRKSKTRSSDDYSPVSSRLRSQKRKELKIISSSSSISSDNTSSAKTRPNVEHSAKFSNVERSPPTEEEYVPIAHTSEETVRLETSETDDRTFTIKDNLQEENKGSSVSVIKEYRTPLGNQFTIRTEYNSAEGTVTGVEVTVKLEDDVPEEEILIGSEEDIKTEAEQDLQAENPIGIKNEDNIEDESLLDSQIIVKTEDEQTNEDLLTENRTTIKIEDYTTEVNEDLQAGNQIMEQDLLDLDRSEITIKTDDDSTEYESLPISLLTIKSEETLTEQESEGQISFKFENEDTDDSQEESPATEDTEQESQEESQVSENTDQDSPEQSQEIVETEDNTLEEPDSSDNSSPILTPIHHFKNPDYGGFPNAETLQSAVDEFIRLVRSEMEKEDQILEEQRRKKLESKKKAVKKRASQSTISSDSNSSEDGLPYERYLHTMDNPDSFTALVPSSERELQSRETDIQREETENWRLSLTSVLDLDDEELISRCLPSDDQQVIFNMLPSLSEDQISVKSIASTSAETTTCELFVVDNRLVEKIGDNDEKASSCSDSLISYSLSPDLGMSLRSGKIKPNRNEFTYMADNLASLFEMMSLNDTEVDVIEEQQTPEETTSSEETIQPPEPVYLSLRGRQVRLRSDNIANVVYQVHRLEVQRNERRQGLKKRLKPKKPKKKEDKILKDKAQIINIRSTRSSTLYSYGKDCTHLAPSKETQKRTKSIQCTMKCGKKKAGTCTSTGEPICSYKCYKKNITRCKKKIRERLETDDHIHVILIEREVDELPDVEPSTSAERNVPERPPKAEKPKKRDDEEEETEEGTEDDETVEESEETSEENYEEESEDEDES